MSLPLIVGCIWVVLATLVAMMPMRLQYLPGFLLLLAAPILLAAIAWVHGGWIFALGLIAFASMFRNPLRYLVRVVAGDKPEIPT
jgi:Protein of unknown function (DUF2484)